MSSLIYLSNDECSSATDAFLHAIYGEDVLSRWRELKCEMEFQSEREYMIWLLDVASQYKQNELDEQTSFNENEELIAEVGGDEKYLGKQDEVELCMEADDVTELDGSDEVRIGGYRTDYQEANESNNEDNLDKPDSRASTFQCRMCTFTCLYRTQLLQHSSEIHHVMLQYHSCTHCTYKSTRLDTLKDHLVRKHAYQSKIVCSKCGKQFIRKCLLRKHEPICQAD